MVNIRKTLHTKPESHPFNQIFAGLVHIRHEICGVIRLPTIVPLESIGTFVESNGFAIDQRTRLMSTRSGALATRIKWSYELFQDCYKR